MTNQLHPVFAIQIQGLKGNNWYTSGTSAKDDAELDHKTLDERKESDLSKDYSSGSESKINLKEMRNYPKKEGLVRDMINIKFCTPLVDSPSKLKHDSSLNILTPIMCLF